MNGAGQLSQGQAGRGGVASACTGVALACSKPGKGDDKEVCLPQLAQNSNQCSGEPLARHSPLLFHRFEDVLANAPVDAVIDCVGGDYEPRSMRVLKRRGAFVSLFAQFAVWPLLKG
jgi:hypothetical protein